MNKSMNGDAVNAYQFSLIDCLKLVDWNRPIT